MKGSQKLYCCPIEGCPRGPNRPFSQFALVKQVSKMITHVTCMHIKVLDLAMMLNPVYFVLYRLAFYEDARREEAQMRKVQQWLQHRMGLEEACRGLRKDLQLYVRLSVRKSNGTVVAHLQNWS